MRSCTSTLSQNLSTYSLSLRPNVGGVVGLADLYVDKALGFSLGWAAWVSGSPESGFQSDSVYAQYNWSVTLRMQLLNPLRRAFLICPPCLAAEITAAAVVIGYWKDIPHVHTV